MEKVNDSIMATETVRTPIATFPHHGIARRVLSVHDMCGDPGQIFRAKDPNWSTDAWVYSQKYDIDVFLKVDEKDLVHPAESLVDQDETKVTH